MSKKQSYTEHKVDAIAENKNEYTKLSPVEWAAIQPVYIAVFIDIFGMGITIPVFSYFLLDLNASTTIIGLTLRYVTYKYKTHLQRTTGACLIIMDVGHMILHQLKHFFHVYMFITKNVYSPSVFSISQGIGNLVMGVLSDK